MPGIDAYSENYLADCKAKLEADLQAYRLQVGNSLDEDFSTRFFNNLVLVMNYMFINRSTDAEGKDGNPLNEVRAIANSLLLNGGKFQPEKQPHWPATAGPSINLPAERTVLGLEAGDEIKLDESDFMRLADAFFTALESRYLEEVDKTPASQDA